MEAYCTTTAQPTRGVWQATTHYLLCALMDHTTSLPVSYKHCTGRLIVIFVHSCFLLRLHMEGVRISECSFTRDVQCEGVLRLHQQVPAFPF